MLTLLVLTEWFYRINKTLLQQPIQLAHYQSLIVRKHCCSSRTENINLVLALSCYLVRMCQSTNGTHLKHEAMFLSLKPLMC